MKKHFNLSKIVTKPWGKEQWIELNDKYCYKRIFINKGFQTSLQYHKNKKETNYVIDGEATFVLGSTIDSLIFFKLFKDDFVTIQPGMIHRFIADTDLILQEVSTPEVDDIFRIQDDTNRPSGRIEKEHEQ